MKLSFDEKISMANPDKRYDFLSVYEDMGAIQFLWDLLEERDFDSVSLSHRIMPTVADHIAFVMSKPYKGWYIINDVTAVDEEWRRVGSIYLSQRNEIGIFIAKDRQRRGAASWAIARLGILHPEVEEFYANMNPRNRASRALFTSCLFQDYQVTMRFRRDGKYGYVLPRFEERIHERPEEREAPPDPRSGKPCDDSETAAEGQREVLGSIEALWGARIVAHAGIRAGRSEV